MQSDFGVPIEVSAAAAAGPEPGAPVVATAAPAVAPVPAAPATPRDLQRAALRDLVALAAECAATEAEIERQYVTGHTSADTELESGNWSLAQRYRTADEQLAQKHSIRLARIDAQFVEHARAARKAHESARERVLREHEPTIHELKGKFEQAVWLADSVLEASQGQLREDLGKSKAAIAEQIALLDGMAQEGDRLLVTYAQPNQPDVPAPQGLDLSDPDAVFAAQRQEAERALAHFGGLKIPRLVVGVTPYVAAIVCTVAAAAVAQWSTGSSQLQPKPIAIGAGAALVVVVALFAFVLRTLARKQVAAGFARFAGALAAARVAAAKQTERAAKQVEERLAAAQQLRDNEVHAAKDRYSPLLNRAKAAREAGLAAAQTDYQSATARAEATRERDKAAAAASLQRHQADLQQRRARELQQVKFRYDQRKRDVQHKYESARAALESRLKEGLATIHAPMDQVSDQVAHLLRDWNDPAWNAWKAPTKFVASVRFGDLEVDLQRVADAVGTAEETNAADAGETAGDGDGNSDGNVDAAATAAASAAKPDKPRLALPPTFNVPATLAFPKQASFLIQADREARPAALRTLQMLMMRLLTSLPPGRVRFNIIDPVGLGQNFAGFMHLADYDDALVGGRILTGADHIEQRLVDLTDHMETVIQKYLRNEYETIDDYNAQAGELAEPYRFLVISDFPVGFDGGDAMRRLSSIVTSGARCGVYTLVFRDTRQALGTGTHLDDLEGYSVNIVQNGDRFVWKDEVFQQFPLTLDPPPDEDFLTRMLHVVGRLAKDAKRVEVPFDNIAPALDKYWTMSSKSDLAVAIGKAGATRLQYMRLGKGVAQHMLIAGKTGSGKSTLLHAMISNLAMWYAPDEVELYLIDFKRGVEFKTYATHDLPHARAIAVESDREFGLSVLQRLDAEIARRGEIFRKAGVQDLAAYRDTDGAQMMPRTLLIIDEFQEFFTEDDKLAQEASLLIDRLVRQGRAFGIHVILGSQTIGGAGGLARSTLSQMAVRIALQTSDADSQLILGDGNSAARLLTRPGEAIYNDAGGLVEANSPFQVAWLPDERRDFYLENVSRKAAEVRLDPRHTPPIVFEGNAPADIARNERLAALLAQPQWGALPTAPLAFLGEPVAIKEPTSVNMRRQSGANTLIVGQADESAISILQSCILSLATQHAPGQAIFYIIDGTPTDSPLAGTLPSITDVIPHEVKLVEFRGAEETIAQLAAECTRRQSLGDIAAEPEIYAIICGLQRYRSLRKSEDDFSFSMSSEGGEKPANYGKLFADLLREGPPHGLHVLAWIDTPTAIDRTLDRNSMREFDTRVLFQMSANDSSNLIDSPAANKLGFFRALSFSEEQGVLEKFRPYALPTHEWLAVVKATLGAARSA